MTDDSFFYGGEDAQRITEEEKERLKEARLQGSVRRFWLPVDPDREVRVTFLDDTTRPSEYLGGITPPIHYYEHQLYLNGHWRNWFTCLGEGKCPICQKEQKRPSWCAAFSVIDHSEWKDKRGNTHKDEIKLLVAKTDMIKRLAKKGEKAGGLRGAVFDVARVSDGDANIGQDYEFVQKLNDDAIANLPEPLPYKELLARKSREELSKIIGLIEQEEDEIQF